ncbi:Uncharacterised protein [Mycobacteroides abscessus subsp. bolletii]|uniref:hypothetical protein n=1 Tax=Mycobacteroides abscessus TaxID=36809 RepID=UPI0009A566C8|nr:hypothetical protein [Mycobacteroides abscessus]SKX81066.1 Uncharacterised protein [Mycobacteroides abscessus subsp. bolletii]
MASEPSVLVGTTTRVSPAELSIYHRNARVGDVDAVMGSLKANGQFKPLCVNIGTQTGRPNEVLAGNHTLKAFRNLAEQNPFDQQWSKIAVHWVDVDDEMATRIVLVDNRSFEDGGFDAAELVELLNEVGTTGTGYSDADLDDLEAAINRIVGAGDRGDDAPALSDGDPDDKAIRYTVVFDDEDQQDTWFDFIKLLKDQYPDTGMTVAERITEHLNDTAGERV